MIQGFVYMRRPGRCYHIDSSEFSADVGSGRGALGKARSIAAEAACRFPGVPQEVYQGIVQPDCVTVVWEKKAILTYTSEDGVTAFGRRRRKPAKKKASR